MKIADRTVLQSGPSFKIKVTGQPLLITHGDFVLVTKRTIPIRNLVPQDQPRLQVA